MTVKQLIQFLKKLPRDMEVTRSYYTCGKDHVVPLEKYDLEIKGETLNINGEEN